MKSKPRIVRRICKDYLDGKGSNRIAKELEDERIPNWNYGYTWAKYMAALLVKIMCCIDALKEEGKDGAKVFCRIRGYISTCRKNSQNLLRSINKAIKGEYFVPQTL